MLCGVHFQDLDLGRMMPAAFFRPRHSDLPHLHVPDAGGAPAANAPVKVCGGVGCLSQVQQCAANVAMILGFWGFDCVVLSF